MWNRNIPADIWFELVKYQPTEQQIREKWYIEEEAGRLRSVAHEYALKNKFLQQKAEQDDVCTENTKLPLEW